MSSESPRAVAGVADVRFLWPQGLVTRCRLEEGVTVPGSRIGQRVGSAGRVFASQQVEDVSGSGCAVRPMHVSTTMRAMIAESRPRLVPSAAAMSQGTRVHKLHTNGWYTCEPSQ